jgi:hypothetical protein
MTSALPSSGRFSQAARALAVGALLALAAACGGNPAGPGSVSGANLAVMLTDAPIDDVQQVQIFFTSVTAKPVGRPVETLVLQLAENPVDLLTLSDRSIVFAAGVVEEGRYEFMHINIDEQRSYLVENGVRKSLRVPSGEVKVLGGFTVDENTRTTLTLDFDAKESLVRLGNGDWLLRPIIVITGNNTSSMR